MHGAYPILSCAEAGAFESAHFAGDEAREWTAMNAAARGIVAGVLTDYGELGGFPSEARVLVLAGKGHNAGDALLAAAGLCARFPGIAVDVVFAFGERSLRPLATRAWRELAPRARVVSADGNDWAAGYDLCLDGVFGLQFRPPLPEPTAVLLRRVNAHPIRLRAAVDLPSGLDAPDAFRADFTYATGIAKRPLLTLPQAGRLRFIDLGFSFPADAVADAVLGAGVLDSLRGLRPPRSDKRHFGHPLIVAGSRRYPGAALMATLAALRSGAGLVTAAVPETLVPAFAAQAPEAIWLGLPETPEGGLALEGLHLVREAFARATAVVLGPGIGRERETLAFAEEIVRESPRPLVIDADALQPEIVAAGRASRILTPHAGEHARIAGALPVGAVVVRKGPITCAETTTAPGAASGTRYHSFFGGPALARGGSGDLLSGIVGTQLAQTPSDPLGAAARGVVWHGAAADMLARACGPSALRITQLLDFLSPALRASGA
jgi:ADP-dependent NAD(P)H-hydrate dehydratase / NAD(P)H-hydrate epimerase